MSKRRMRAGGCLFTFGLVGIIVCAAIYRAATGHLPAELSYAVLGLIALSIVTDVYFELDSAIERGASQIEDKLRDLEREVATIKEQCLSLNWKLDNFKAEFDETAKRGLNRQE